MHIYSKRLEMTKDILQFYTSTKKTEDAWCDVTYNLNDYVREILK